MASAFIPNSFQNPNIYVDRCMAFLTNNELRVLVYMVRRIFGFQKREDRISLSQITDGLVTKQGVRLDYGAGLSRPAAIKAIAGLTHFRLVLELDENDPITNEGKLYGLELDEDCVDFAGLEKRKGITRRLEAERTKKGRDAVKAKKEATVEVNEIYPPERRKSDLPAPVNEIYPSRSMGFTHKVSGEIQGKNSSPARGKDDTPPAVAKWNSAATAPQQSSLLGDAEPIEAPTVPAPTKGNGKATKAKGNPNTQPILKAYYEALGYAPIFDKADAKAAKAIADAGYTPEQVTIAYDHMRKSDYWKDHDHISLMSVSKQIGGILKRLGKSGANGSKGKAQKGETFTDSNGRQYRRTESGLEVFHPSTGWGKTNNPTILQQLNSGD